MIDTAVLITQMRVPYFFTCSIVFLSLSFHSVLDPLDPAQEIRRKEDTSQTLRDLDIDYTTTNYTLANPVSEHAESFRTPALPAVVVECKGTLTPQRFKPDNRYNSHTISDWTYNNIGELSFSASVLSCSSPSFENIVVVVVFFFFLTSPFFCDLL